MEQTINGAKSDAVLAQRSKLAEKRRCGTFRVVSHCLSSAFHHLSLTYHCHSLTFPLPLLDLSNAFPCRFTLPFLGLSPPFLDLSLRGFPKSLRVPAPNPAAVCRYEAGQFLFNQTIVRDEMAATAQKRQVDLARNAHAFTMSLYLRDHLLSASVSLDSPRWPARWR